MESLVTKELGPSAERVTKNLGSGYGYGYGGGTGGASSHYDAINSKGRRLAPRSIIKSEDNTLKNNQRNRLTGTTQDLARNFSLVGWAIRKHLDYVSMFEFQMRTENAALNESIEKTMGIWQRPENCDATGRHPFPKMLRTFEAMRTTGSDVFGLLLRNLQIQAIEGDRIRNPTGTDETLPSASKYTNGVRVNTKGKSTAYALHNRTQGGGYTFVRDVSAKNMIQHAYFERFDQVRGVSPIAAAVNSFRDVYEGIDYALAKMKVEQLFALVFFRNAEESIGEVSGEAGDKAGYDVNFGRGPIQLDLEDGDRAEFLKTDNPGSNTQDFLKAVVGIALKSLDIPYNFYDESHTNFFGSRAAWLLYDRSCISKREDVREFLRKITVWLLRGWIADGLLTLPAGMTVNDLVFEWVPRGMPWWDPAKEITGSLKAMGAGLDNPYRICKETGRGEFEENVDQLARAMQYAESKGVPLVLADVPAASTSAIGSDVVEENEQESDDEEADEEQNEIPAEEAADND